MINRKSHIQLGKADFSLRHSTKQLWSLLPLLFNILQTDLVGKIRKEKYVKGMQMRGK